MKIETLVLQARCSLMSPGTRHIDIVLGFECLWVKRRSWRQDHIIFCSISPLSTMALSVIPYHKTNVAICIIMWFDFNLYSFFVAFFFLSHCFSNQPRNPTIPPNEMLLFEVSILWLGALTRWDFVHHSSSFKQVLFQNFLLYHNRNLHNSLKKARTSKQVLGHHTFVLKGYFQKSWVEKRIEQLDKENHWGPTIHYSNPASTYIYIS